jgi:tetratricopeptide (TPR) repeat protein
MIRVNGVLSLILIGIMSQISQAQEIGDTIVVLRETKMKRGQDVVQTLRAGEFFRVEDVDSTWLWVSAKNTGWIAKPDVSTPKHAVAYFSKRIEEVSDDVGACVARGNARLASRQIEEAIADYDEALRLDPKMIEALVSRANARAEMRQFEKALVDLHQALGLDPHSVDALFLRGTLLAERGQFEKAAADLSECLGHCPGYAGAYRNRAGLWLETHDFERAFADADQATELDPRNSSAFSARGAALLGAGKVEEALVDLDESLNLDPNNRHAHIMRGHARCHKKEFQQSLVDLTAALKLHQDAPALVLRGDIRAELGEFEKAIADYTAALKLDPADMQALHSRSSAWLYERNYAKALADVSEVLRQYPNDVFARRRRAFIRAAAPDPKFRDGKQAVVDAMHACDLTQWKQPEAISVLAAGYAEIGDFAKAIEFESKAIKLATDKGLQQELTRTLELYKQRLPYRFESEDKAVIPTAGRAQAKPTTNRR